MKIHQIYLFACSRYAFKWTRLSVSLVPPFLQVNLFSLSPSLCVWIDQRYLGSFFHSPSSLAINDHSVNGTGWHTQKGESYHVKDTPVYARELFFPLSLCTPFLWQFFCNWHSPLQIGLTAWRAVYQLSSCLVYLVYKQVNRSFYLSHKWSYIIAVISCILPCFHSLFLSFFHCLPALPLLLVKSLSLSASLSLHPFSVVLGAYVPFHLAPRPTLRR